MEKLPDDILTDIFLRLPIKPLGLSSCVSKKWYITITSLGFSNIYIKQEISHNPDFIICYKNSLHGSDYQLHFVENDIVRPSMIDYLPFIKPSFLRNLIVMGSCNGLLCLSTLDYPVRYIQYIFGSIPSNPIYILNPITGEHMALPHFIYPDCIKMEGFMSGFGFDDVKQEYKLVLVMFYKYDVRSQYIENEVQVYTLGRKSWNRMVGIVPDVLRNAYHTLSRVFIDGCIYWITVNDLYSLNGRPVVVFFDLGPEKFSVFSTPRSIVSNGEYSKPLECIILGVLEEHLSLTDSSTDFIQIWQMKNDNGNKSWIHLFAMQKDYLFLWHIGPVEPIKLRKNDELVVHNSPEIVSYNTKSGKCEYLKVDGTWAKEKHCSEVVPFVGSLISIKSACGTGTMNKSEKSSCRRAESKKYHMKFSCCLQ